MEKVISMTDLLGENKVTQKRNIFFLFLYFLLVQMLSATRKQTPPPKTSLDFNWLILFIKMIKLFWLVIYIMEGMARLGQSSPRNQWQLILFRKKNCCKLVYFQTLPISHIFNNSTSPWIMSNSHKDHCIQSLFM